MEKNRIETEEYENNEGFLAWCTVCQLILIEGVTQNIADAVAEDHINRHKHLTFVASPNKSPYEP